jgi:hypothetical protein
VDQRRRDLVVGLRGRREEIARAVLVRVHAIDAPDRVVDPEYLQGLRLAVEAAIDHTIEASEGPGESARETVPEPLLSQARLAARRRIPLETMLRRYLAGHAVLGDFVVEEAMRQALPPEILRWVLRSQAARTDQVVATISATYAELLDETRPFSTARRRAERVRRLLDGELLDGSDLGYDLSRWHVAMIASGPSPGQSIRSLARELGRQALVVDYEPELTWAWLGGTRETTPEQLEAVVRWTWPVGLRLAVGEPGRDLAGWRLSHQQAAAALPIAQRGPDRRVRYADVAVLAAAVHDQILAASLRTLYLARLASAADGGGVLRGTLRAWFATGLNTTSAAASLGVTRHTVANRLRVAEDLLERPLEDCALDLQVALRLDRVESHTTPA